MEQLTYCRLVESGVLLPSPVAEKNDKFAWPAHGLLELSHNSSIVTFLVDFSVTEQFAKNVLVVTIFRVVVKL
jgi:hypothetical protein